MTARPFSTLPLKIPKYNLDPHLTKEICHILIQMLIIDIPSTKKTWSVDPGSVPKEILLISTVPLKTPTRALFESAIAGPEAKRR